MTGQAHGVAVPIAEMLVVGKEVTVYSDDEQPMHRVAQWSNRPLWDPADLPACVVAAASLAFLVMVLGGAVASFGVGVAAALVWALWRLRERARRARSRQATGARSAPGPDCIGVG